MATATTVTAWNNALKQYYRPDEVRKVVYDSHPLMELMPKDESFRGKNAPVPVYFTRPQGVSATFSTAQSNASASKIGEFLMTRKTRYGVATISGEAVAASEGDRFSFLNAMTTEIDGVLRSVGDSVATALYRDGSGAIGQCNASVSSTSLVLKNSNDVVNFEVGMELVFSATKSGGSLKSGNVTITAINRSTGTLTGDALSAIAGGSGVAANDFIYMQGDYDGLLTGLEGWLPATAPSGGDSFFGQDRSTDATRLAGQRFDGSSGTITEAIIEGAALTAREGGKPDYMFCSFSDFVNLEKTMNAQVNRQVQQNDSISGYRSLEFFAPHGVVQVVPDKSCPSGTAYLLQMDTWSLMSIGPMVQLTELDGNRVLRQSSDDGVEVRVHSYANMACEAPGYNCVITLPS